MPDQLDKNLFSEKVLQFGTGILLRGLPDYFIDKANRRGIFNGRIVVVKSTPGNAESFDKNGAAFLTCIRGIDRGKTVEEDLLNTSISKVLTANEQWSGIVQVACNPSLQIIISNTTEIGIRFEAESIHQSPPKSFPAKLTALLYERFKKLGDQTLDLVVIPTELVTNNGKLLRDIVSQLVEYNNLGNEFSLWLIDKVTFCSSLVDRIVTKPSDKIKQGPDFNSLTIQAEPYKLWAIEGGQKVKNILSFAKADDDVIIAPDITNYRERKIRLLNGTHTISVCLGFLNGFDTVVECMEDKEMSLFVENVMLTEIEPTLTSGTRTENGQFALEVLDRFRNPFTAHRLLSITLQATAKMKMRNVDTLIRYVRQFNAVPDLMAKGFAAYLLFMKASYEENGNVFGLRRGVPYPIQDDQAVYFYQAWKGIEPTESSIFNFVRKVCQNTSLWDKDLTQLPKFAESVSGHLVKLMQSVGS